MRLDRQAAICTLAVMRKPSHPKGARSAPPPACPPPRPRSPPCSPTGSIPSTRCRACTTIICSTRSSAPATRLRVVHTRHEQGAAYMALGAALATGKPQAYCVVPGPGLLNSGAALLTAYGMNAPVLALIGQIPARRDRPGARPSARNPRPGRHHRAAGRSFRPHRRTGGSARQGRQGDRVHAARPARPGGARMRHRRVGQARARCARPADAGAQRRASTRTKCARPPNSSAKPSAC